MAPTRMKLRVRRRDNTAGGAGDGQPEQQGERRRESTGRSSRRKAASNASAEPAAATSSSSPPTSSASASVRAVMAAEDASPDSKCPICLDRFNNLAYLDRCLHRFCFPCIQEWSHNKPECPLCKQPFTSILHSVRAENDFKEYTLRPAPADGNIAATVAMVAAMASRIDHQMRLQLRRHRVEDGSEMTTRRHRRERGGRGGGSRRAGERSRVLEWYLDPHPPHPPAGTDDSDEAENLAQQSLRGEADLTERGVIFEGLTGLGGAVAPLTPNDRAARRLMTRLAARQRTQREGGTVRRLREREMVAFRRALYRCGIRVRGVAGVSGNQGQQQRDITADSFRQNSAHLNRLRPWLRRELTVLYGAHGVLVHIVQRIIMARLALHGLEDTPTIEEELRPFLLARTDHFLHELVSFARSPLSLDTYDLQAVYELPAAALELDRVSSSSESSSVIAISEGEEEEPTRGRSEEGLQGRPVGAHDIDIQSGSCLSLSAWDDETPGPSYSTAEPSCSLASLSFSPVPQEASNEVGGQKREEGEAEEECLIVGYKKPIAERTPELVQLSSDTEEDVEEKKEEKEKVEENLLPLTSTTPPLSYLPTVPPSTSGAYRDKEVDSLKEKDGDAEGHPSRARSWSGSSGRSRESVFTLSPSEQRQESWKDRKQSGGEAAKEKRRRKKRRRGRERSSEWLRKSGTLYNPNRSIFPAMMHQRSRSPSPFHSSIDSGSPLPPSPPDSSWDYNCSPLSSSLSSSSHASSSPLSTSPHPSLPPQTPPTPSLSPRNPYNGEKPGGKRKYKSRHLDSNKEDPTWRPSLRRERKRKRMERRKRRGRDGGRRKERHRRDSHKEGGEYGGESSRLRDDRSPSVEIIYEGTVASAATQPPACRRRKRRHRRTPLTSSPVIITLDSDSSHDDVNNQRVSSSSSPLSSQQTVDFSDLPPLALVPSGSAGGGLEAEIGELPVDILDRGSDGSDTEPAGQTEPPVNVENGDSDREVDVETIDGSLLLGGKDTNKRRSSNVRADTKEDTSNNYSETDSDSRLLATVLSDLKGISAPQTDLSFNFGPSCSPETRKQRFRNPCEVSQACSNEDPRLAERKPASSGFPDEHRSRSVTNQDQGLDLSTCQPKGSGVREDGRDVWPLRSYNRKSLKRKQCGNLDMFPIPPVNVHLPHIADTDSVYVKSPVGLSSGPTVSPANLHLAAELASANQTIPPISALSSELGSALHSSHSAAAPASSQSAFVCSSPVSENSDDNFNSSKLHSRHENISKMYSAPRSSHIHLRPVNFHPAQSGWSTEQPVHADSTSGGCRDQGQTSCRVQPTDLHPCRSVSASGGVFSGANSNNTSPLASASSTDLRTHNPNSPIDSQISNEEQNYLDGRVEPESSDAASGLTDREGTAPRGVQPASDLHSADPAPLNITSTAAEGPFGRSALSRPAEHTITFHTSPAKCASQLQPPAPSNSKLLCLTDSGSKHHNHVDVCSAPHFPTDARSAHNAPTDSQCEAQPPVDLRPRNSLTGFKLHTNNHMSLPQQPQWKSDATDALPGRRPPGDERSGSVWTTRALPFRTDK